MNPQHYRRRAARCQAVRLTDDNDWDEIARWCRGEVVDTDQSGRPIGRAVLVPEADESISPYARTDDMVVLWLPHKAWDIWSCDQFHDTFEPAPTPPDIAGQETLALDGGHWTLDADGHPVYVDATGRKLAALGVFTHVEPEAAKPVEARALAALGALITRPGP